MPAE
jgi:hypothetical protein